MQILYVVIARQPSDQTLITTTYILPMWHRHVTSNIIYTSALCTSPAVSTGNGQCQPPSNVIIT